MTTFAPNDSRLDERVREAWTAYRDALADLVGREYDDAEVASWDRLQHTLRDIESDRTTLEAAPEAGA